MFGLFCKSSSREDISSSLIYKCKLGWVADSWVVS